MIKQLIALGAAGAAAAALAVPALAATRTVKVDDNVFKADSITIHKGDKVHFRFVGSAMHNVTRASGPSFKRITNRKSGTISRTFSHAGTYHLVCTIHPGMTLKVKVRNERERETVEEFETEELENSTETIS